MIIKQTCKDTQSAPLTVDKLKAGDVFSLYDNGPLYMVVCWEKPEAAQRYYVTLDTGILSYHSGCGKHHPIPLRAKVHKVYPKATLLVNGCEE